MDALLVTSISQAAATQRAGRAGRTAPGKAYRLYSSDSYDHLPPDTVPEIQRSSLLSTVLALKRMNIIDILHFEFIDKPDETLVMKALTQLFLLGAIDQNGVITDLGKQMNSFPLSPYLSRVIISSATEHECSEEVLTIASILAGDHDLFRAPSPRQGEELVAEAEKCKLKLAHHTGDHMTVLNVWRAWRDNDESKKWSRNNWINHKALVTAKSVRSQLIDIMKDLKLPLVRACRIEVEKSSRKKDGRPRETIREVDAVPILKSFLTGYYTNIANKAQGRSVFSHYSPDQHFGEKTSLSSSALVALHLHPLCALSDMFDRNKTKYSQIDWVMYMHVTYTNKAVMKGVSKILWDWVRGGKGHERIGQLASANLNGESTKIASKKRKQLLADDSTPASSAESSDTEAGTGTDAELEEDRKRLRKLEIDKIRERALARRNLK
jgi:HrpA-like RNA helicase